MQKRRKIATKVKETVKIAAEVAKHATRKISTGMVEETIEIVTN